MTVKGIAAEVLRHLTQEAPQLSWGPGSVAWLPSPPQPWAKSPTAIADLDMLCANGRIHAIDGGWIGNRQRTHGRRPS